MPTVGYIKLISSNITAWVGVKIVFQRLFLHGCFFSSFPESTEVSGYKSSVKPSLPLVRVQTKPLF